MDQFDWDGKLPSALAAIHTAPNSTTRETPYFLLFGSEAKTIGDIGPSNDTQGGWETLDAK